MKQICMITSLLLGLYSSGFTQLGLKKNVNLVHLKEYLKTSPKVVISLNIGIMKYKGTVKDGLEKKMNFSLDTGPLKTLMDEVVNELKTIINLENASVIRKGVPYKKVENKKTTAKKKKFMDDNNADVLLNINATGSSSVGTNEEGTKDWMKITDNLELLLCVYFKDLMGEDANMKKANNNYLYIPLVSTYTERNFATSMDAVLKGLDERARNKKYNDADHGNKSYGGFNENVEKLKEVLMGSTQKRGKILSVDNGTVTIILGIADKVSSMYKYVAITRKSGDDPSTWWLKETDYEVAVALLAISEKGENESTCIIKKLSKGFEEGNLVGSELVYRKDAAKILCHPRVAKTWE